MRLAGYLLAAFVCAATLETCSRDGARMLVASPSVALGWWLALCLVAAGAAVMSEKS